MTLDRVGPLATAASTAYIFAGQVIDTVNTWTEYVALVIAVLGVFAGIWRLASRGARMFVWTEEVVDLLRGLKQRLEHGDQRMGRIEEHLGLDPMPFPGDDS